MTEYNSGKWIGWNGGECPVHPKTKIEAVLRNRAIAFDSVDCAGEMDWSVDPMRLRPCDIIAFRVVNEYREPRDWWIVEEYMMLFQSQEKAQRACPGHTPIHVREVTE